jgi:NAD(P)-dependent dehydrogenase (short-subunit alcohol dehydrogenase family)
MENWKFIMNVNLWGVIHGLDVFLPRMRAQKGEKHIVNTASLGLAGLMLLFPLASGAVRRPLDPHFSRSPHECHYSQA